MSDSVSIRKYLPGDLERICAVAVAAWRAIHEAWRRELPADLYEMLHGGWEARKTSAIRRFCGGHGDWVRVAVREGQVVGFITFTLDRQRQTGEIGNNAVDPAYQGQGIGQRMYAQVLAIFEAEGMTYATVKTGGDPGHAPARRAYEKAGFDIACPTVRYYRRLNRRPARA